MGKIMDGRRLSELIKHKVRKEVKTLKNTGVSGTIIDPAETINHADVPSLENKKTFI